jgi:hypothetical protein
MFQNHLLAYQIDQGYLWPSAYWMSSTPRARIDSSVRRCTPQPTHILGAVAHLVPASVEGLGGFLPGELARPAGQKQHIGSGQLLLPIAPGFVLDHYATYFWQSTRRMRYSRKTRKPHKEPTNGSVLFVHRISTRPWFPPCPARAFARLAQSNGDLSG